jgi:hypothetical protein
VVATGAEHLERPLVGVGFALAGLEHGGGDGPLLGATSRFGTSRPISDPEARSNDGESRYAW